MPRRIYRLFALCLALTWGPASMCCALEAAGWDVMCSDAACHEEATSEAKTDGCNVVEAGDYQSAVPSLKISPHFVAVSAYLVCTRIPEFQFQRLEAVVDPEFGRPRDWVPVWQFERRAAAPAHAPDSLNA